MHLMLRDLNAVCLGFGEEDVHGEVKVRGWFCDGDFVSSVQGLGFRRRRREMAFAATRVMEVVIKRSGGLVWKNWPMNHTRRANAKKRHVRLQQVEAVLKACASSAPSTSAQTSSKSVAQVTQVTK